jgi:hypothetical protein
MLNRHTIKAYALANEWEQISTNQADCEQFTYKGNFDFLLLKKDGIVGEDIVLDYAIQQIHNQEEIPLVELINYISNHWLPFDPDNIPEAVDKLCLLLTIDGSWFDCFNSIERSWYDNEGNDLQVIKN